MEGSEKASRDLEMHDELARDALTFIEERYKMKQQVGRNSRNKSATAVNEQEKVEFATGGGCR